MSRHGMWSALLVGSLLGGIGVGVNAAERDGFPGTPFGEGVPLQFILQDAEEAEEKAEPAREEVRPDRPRRGYWIGVGISAVPEAVRAQLDIPEDSGVLIEMAADGSPAAKAGLQEYDVLVKVGDQKIAGMRELVDVVTGSEGKELTFEVIRQGKRQTIAVTPEERPAHTPPGFGRRPGNRDQWMDRFGPDQSQFRMRFGGFGDRERNPHQAELPEGMTVTITKTGDQPAKVMVRRGDESWETTVEKLDALPEDVRKTVREFIGGDQQRGFHFELDRNRRDFDRGRFDPRDFGRGFDGDMARQLRDLRQQMERLRRSVEELENDDSDN